MTVAELIEHLKTLDQSAIVIVHGEQGTELLDASKFEPCQLRKRKDHLGEDEWEALRDWMKQFEDYGNPDDFPINGLAVYSW